MAKKLTTKKLTPRQASIYFPKSQLYKAGFTTNGNFQVAYKSGETLLFTKNGEGSLSFTKVVSGKNQKILKKAMKLNSPKKKAKKKKK
jgi:hypothetical protein